MPTATLIDPAVLTAPLRDKQQRPSLPMHRSLTQAGLPTSGFPGRLFLGDRSSKRKPRFAGLSWAGQDSNLRSSDYELRVRRRALLS